MTQWSHQMVFLEAFIGHGESKIWWNVNVLNRASGVVQWCDFAQSQITVINEEWMKNCTIFRKLTKIHLIFLRNLDLWVIFKVIYHWKASNSKFKFYVLVSIFAPSVQGLALVFNLKELTRKFGIKSVMNKWWITYAKRLTNWRFERWLFFSKKIENRKLSVVSGLFKEWMMYVIGENIEVQKTWINYNIKVSKFRIQFFLEPTSFQFHHGIFVKCWNLNSVLWWDL